MRSEGLFEENTSRNITQLQWFRSIQAFTSAVLSFWNFLLCPHLHFPLHMEDTQRSYPMG